MVKGETPRVLGAGESGVVAGGVTLLVVGEIDDGFYSKGARAGLAAVLCGVKDTVDSALAAEVRSWGRLFPALGRGPRGGAGLQPARCGDRNRDRPHLRVHLAQELKFKNRHLTPALSPIEAEREGKQKTKL